MIERAGHAFAALIMDADNIIVGRIAVARHFLRYGYFNPSAKPGLQKNGAEVEGKGDRCCRSVLLVSQKRRGRACEDAGPRRVKA